MTEKASVIGERSGPSTIDDVKGRPARLGTGRGSVCLRHSVIRLTALTAATATALVLAAAGAGATSYNPAGAPPVTPLVPGVIVERLERPGPQIVHVVRIRQDPRLSVGPRLVEGSPLVRGSLRSDVAAGGAEGLVAAVNGDFFNFTSGYPSGVLFPGRRLVSEPEPSRSALIVKPGPALAVERLALNGQWQPFDARTGETGEIRKFQGVNRPLETGSEIVLYTPALGRTTTLNDGGSRFEIRVRRDGPGEVLPNVPFTGTVVGRRPVGGSTIGANHVVLTGSGSQGARLASELPLGSKISLFPAIEGLPEDAVAALGGGPVLVRDGEAVVAAGEGFSTSQLGSRTSRTAVGQRANGAIILVLAEGPSQGSRGVTAGEQALLLKELGARTAIAMDAGGSAQLAVFDRLLPSTATRGITDAFAVSYRGVQLPPLPARISPNGDGVDDAAATTARAPVAGRLRLTVAKRNGSFRRQLRNRPLGPGALETTFNPRSLRLADGIYVVTAIFEPFDGSPGSRQTRRVIVDRTLSHLTTRPFTRRKRPQLDARFRLTRPARVTVRVLDAAGAPLKTLVSGKVLRKGRHRVVWNRRARGITISGAVTIQVEARNRFGRSGLQDRMTLKRPASPLTQELRRLLGASSR